VALKKETWKERRDREATEEKERLAQEKNAKETKEKELRDRVKRETEIASKLAPEDVFKEEDGAIVSLLSDHLTEADISARERANVSAGRCLPCSPLC
jgi:hypothetical protein